MLKETELGRLREFVAVLPRESYLHAMLAHILPQFEQDIRSDFPTLPDVAQIERDTRAAEIQRDAARRDAQLASARLESIKSDGAGLLRRLQGGLI